MLLLYYNDYNVSSGNSCLSYIAIMFWTTTGVAVYDRTALSFRLNWKRSELHFSKSERVAVGVLPVIPRHTIIVRRCVAAGAVVETVQVGVMTVVVPPATFACSCTRSPWPRVVIPVSSAELLSKMISQWITLKQQTRFTKVFYCICCISPNYVTL